MNALTRILNNSEYFKNFIDFSHICETFAISSKSVLLILIIFCVINSVLSVFNCQISLYYFLFKASLSEFKIKFVSTNFYCNFPYASPPLVLFFLTLIAF